MNKYQSLASAKETLLAKVQRKLSNNFPDYEYDEDLLGDYFDDAVDIIKSWLRASDTSLVLTGNYDRNIVDFIVQSINISGLEGQSASSANGVSKTFIATPEANLKASIPQSL